MKKIAFVVAVAAAVFFIAAFPEPAAAGAVGKKGAKGKTTMTKKAPKRGGYPLCRNDNSKVQLPALVRAGLRLQLRLNCWSAIIEMPDMRGTIAVDYEPARGVRVIDLFVLADGRELRGADLSNIPMRFRARGSGVLLITVKDIEEDIEEVGKITGARIWSM